MHKALKLQLTCVFLLLEFWIGAPDAMFQFPNAILVTCLRKEESDNISRKLPKWTGGMEIETI